MRPGNEANKADFFLQANVSVGHKGKKSEDLDNFTPKSRELMLYRKGISPVIPTTNVVHEFECNPIGSLQVWQLDLNSVDQNHLLFENQAFGL